MNILLGESDTDDEEMPEEDPEENAPKRPRLDPRLAELRPYRGGPPRNPDGTVFYLDRTQAESESSQRAALGAYVWRKSDNREFAATLK